MQANLRLAKDDLLSAQSQMEEYADKKVDILNFSP